MYKDTLCIADLHLGLEEHAANRGLLIPKYQLSDIMTELKSMLPVHRIIINGDLKHEFNRISPQEWKDTKKLITFLKKNCEEIIIVKGNHDTFLKPVAERLGVILTQEYKIDDVLFIHGDRLPHTKADLIIMGHEHPAVVLSDKGHTEKYKCHLKGKYENTALIVQASFNPLIHGTDVLKGKFLSPMLKDIKDFEVWIIEKNEVLFFGKVKELRNMITRPD